MGAAVRHDVADAVFTAGAMRMALRPSAGGRIAALWHDDDGVRRDILVPMLPGPFDPADWPKAGCYPLLPFSNRIRDAVFTADGTVVRLPAHPPGPHALHGFSQRRPWSLHEAAAGPVMRFEHEADAWPWAFAAEQRLALDADGLTVTLWVHNRAATAMPLGMGLHPYLAASPADRVRFAAASEWAVDEDFIATTPGSVPVRHDALLGTAPVTRYCAGWDGAVTLLRSGSPPVSVTAGAPLDHLVFHVPPGGAYLCAEPVSHVADAFNLAARGVHGTGHRMLAPGEEVTASMRIGIG